MNLKSLGVIGTLLLTTQLTGCFMQLSQADANEEIVLVAKPYFVGDGGLDLDPVTNGSAWIAASTSQYSCMSPKSYRTTATDVISSDNVPMDISAVAIIAIKEGESPLLHRDFGRDWYKNKVARQFSMLTRNFVRDTKHKDLMNDKKIINAGQARLKLELSAYLTAQEIQVELQDVILGKATPPEALLTQIEATSAQTERKHTESQRKLAVNAVNPRPIRAGIQGESA